MTGRAVLSPRAQGDIDDIWNHSAKRWGIDQAEFYVRRLAQHIEDVAARPAIGRVCSEIRAGYRRHRSGSHFLFYRLTDDGIEVVRILHERMSFGRHL